MAWSWTTSPVSQPLRWPTTGASHRVRSYTSGSASRSHIAFGAVWDASGFRPVRATSSSSPASAQSCADCRAARRSSQMIAGLSGRSSASSATSPSTWHARESISTSSLETPACSRTSRTAEARACVQSSGSCSAQPAAGWLMPHGAAEVATVTPSESMMSALMLCDPTSAPMTWLISPICLTSDDFAVKPEQLRIPFPPR